MSTLHLLEKHNKFPRRKMGGGKASKIPVDTSICKSQVFKRAVENLQWRFPLYRELFLVFYVQYTYPLGSVLNSAGFR